MNRQECGIGAVVLAFVALLAGCANSRTFAGRVLPGRAGLITLVGAADPRLTEAGVAGVRVRVVEGTGSPGSLAEGVSGPDGSFTLNLPGTGSTGRLDIVVSGDEVLTTRGTIYVPAKDQRVLVIVEPRREEPEQQR